jgi:VWFA-related protein
VAHSDLVVLRVSVTDRKQDLVAGLTKDDFTLYEDGRRQVISVFSSDDMPVTIGLVIDGSSSMAPRREHVIAAGLAFARSSRADDEFFMIDFNEHVHDGLPEEVPFTSDTDVLRSALSRMRTRGKTALYDAVAHGLDYLDRGHRDQKALIVVSDGRDNESVMTFSQLTQKAAASRAVIYAIGLAEEGSADANPGILKRLAAITGGEAFFPNETAALVTTLERIARDIRTSYTLGYVPTDASDDGRFRRVRVLVRGTPGGTHVRHRDGYTSAGVAHESP